MLLRMLLLLHARLACAVLWLALSCAAHLQIEVGVDMMPMAAQLTAMAAVLIVAAVLAVAAVLPVAAVLLTMAALAPGAH
jgi:hypothetical protein